MLYSPLHDKANKLIIQTFNIYRVTVLCHCRLNFKKIVIVSSSIKRSEQKKAFLPIPKLGISLTYLSEFEII